MQTDDGVDALLREVVPSLKNLKKLVMGSTAAFVAVWPTPICLSDLTALARLTQLTHLDIRTLSIGMRNRLHNNRSAQQAADQSVDLIPDVSTEQAEAAYAALSGLTNLENLTLQGFGAFYCANREPPRMKHTDKFLLVRPFPALPVHDLHMTCIRVHVS